VTSITDIWHSPGYSGGTLSLTFISLVGGLIIANCVLGLMFGRRFRRRGWDDCPETSARIRSSLVCSSDDGQRTHVGYVLFTYRVGGQDFSGLCLKSFPTEQEASTFVEGCSGRELAVRYKPESPERALLFTR
jgi:hypothetical protein